MSDTHIWRNLILQGGGIKTFVFHGALLALDEANVLANINRVAGTSAGAMLAALLSFRLPIRETLAFYETVDMARIPQNSNNEEVVAQAWLQSRLKGFTERTETMSRFVKKYGWYASSYAYNWIQETIASQCDGNGQATFADFRARGFRDLYIIATNVSKQKGEVFSAETTPDAPVAAALLISHLIPLFFESIQFDGKHIGQGDFYADGGLVDNYPIDLFDYPRYLDDGALLRDGFNWQTLGLHNYTPKDLNGKERPITGLLTYMENLAQMIRNMQDLKLSLHQLNLHRTIQISNLGVSATNFSIKPVPGDKLYEQLVSEGYREAQAFLVDYGCDKRPFPV